MFTQKCFIRKNTPELVKRLEELGYKVSFSARNGYGKYLYAFNGTVVSGEYNAYDENAGFIDCKESDERFLATAALRDDTDNGQWFTDGEYWVLCKEDDWRLNEYRWPPNIFFHKATVQDLLGCDFDWEDFIIQT